MSHQSPVRDFGFPEREALRVKAGFCDTENRRFTKPKFERPCGRRSVKIKAGDDLDDRGARQVTVEPRPARASGR